MKSRLDTHAVSFSLSAHPTRKQISDRPTEHARCGPVDDGEQPGRGGAANGQTAATRVARQTWVHDHDVLELRYVN